MVDFKELRDKAQGLLAEHSDSVKQGITKAGGFVGTKVGRDKVDPIEGKLHDFVDKAARKDGTVPPAAQPTDQPPTARPFTDPSPPPSSTPNPPPAAV
jgi:hypothetical protein